MYQLSSAPVSDSLVYMTEAFNDYWLFRSGKFSTFFYKYYVIGNQINSPLLSFLAVISFLFLGLDPLNAYLLMGFLYLLWIAGIIYLAWLLIPNNNFILACGILAACLPSACVYQLRHFMLDFAAATPFIWATAFLIKSNLFNNRKEVIYYALFVSATISFRSTAFIYFFSHIFIILFQSVNDRKYPNFKNILLAGFIIISISSIFIIPNLERILYYYGYWAQQSALSQQKNSFFGNFIFYLNELDSFHMSRQGFIVYCVLTLLGACTLIAKNIYNKNINNNNEIKSKIIFPLVICLLIIIIPTALLSSYSSRASTVDFIFIGAYIFLPVIIWCNVFQKSIFFWVPVLLILLAFCRTDFKLLIEGVQFDSSEREVLSVILADAEKRGLNEVTLGNTAIHQHNSLSYQYWTLANYFPKWTNRVKLAAIGRTNSADDLASMNGGADYVIVLDGYHADWHPNNVVAPAANKILMEKFHMKMLPYEFNLPDGVTVKVLARQVSAKIPAPHVDGWHENGLFFRLKNPLKQEIFVKISGELMNAKKDQMQASILLASKLNPSNKLSFITSSGSLNYVIKIPATFFNISDTVDFELSSSIAGIPSSISTSKDNRNLAFRNLKIQIIN